jgi:predicted metal-dependent enzyme (double-stranded beta helix superfamily)
METLSASTTFPETVPADALGEFVERFGEVVDTASDEKEVLDRGAALLATLVQSDDWLPASHAIPGADRYRQYLLHLDPRNRFSVVSFVWGPGQTTPIHDHTVWGLIGMLRGAEVEQHYRRQQDGSLLPEGAPQRLEPGAVDAVSPRIGDLHRVSNAYEDRTSISIHVYAGNIGAVERSVYDVDGTSKRFISGYSDLVQAQPRNVRE